MQCPASQSCEESGNEKVDYEEIYLKVCLIILSMTFELNKRSEALRACETFIQATKEEVVVVSMKNTKDLLSLNYISGMQSLGAVEICSRGHC